jgi:hypothetical protein
MSTISRLRQIMLLLAVATALAIQIYGAGAGLQRNVCLSSIDSEEKPGENRVASAAGAA